MLEAARHQVQQGRQFHFVSKIPAPKLDELTDRARRSASVEAFLADWLTEGLRGDFSSLSEEYGSDQVAWHTLRGAWFHCQDEVGLRRVNDALAELLLAGAPATAAWLSLGDLANQNLGVRLTAAAIEERLPEYELSRAQLIGNPTVAQAVDEVLASWKASVALALLSPAIVRTESTDLADRLRSSDTPVTMVVGAAGAGKSGVLWQSVQELEAEEHWPILAFRLDRLESMASTSDLGHQLGLGVSPVTALAAVAAGGPCLLVVDQLDAVSFASGRLPSGFNTVVDLIREAAAFPQMRVLLACRAFDVDNDHRIRQLVADNEVGRLDVGPLTGGQVDAAVAAMGLSPAQLTADQRSLLASPFNLVLLSAIADEPEALSFTSDNGLLASYWDRKRRDCAGRRQPPPRFAAVIRTLANAMSQRQQLTARISVLDADELATDAEVLASEHVLAKDGQRYAFFHESFFDYAFARLWLDLDQSLVEFLLADEQELFRRAQVKQILLHIRDDDPERFIREAEAVLAHPKIRFHIKAVVLAVLRSLADPTSAEWQMIQRLMADGRAAGGPPVGSDPHQWRGSTGSTPKEWSRAGWPAEITPSTSGPCKRSSAAIKPRADRMAELIAPLAGTDPAYLAWLAWVTRFADVHTSRPLFDLMLAAVRRGDYNNNPLALWNAVFGLGQHQPGWAVELLATWLLARPGVLAQDASGRPVDLDSHEHNLLELVPSGAAGAPEAYAARLVPYLLMAMELTKRDPAKRPVHDHFSYRQELPAPCPTSVSALLHGAAAALRFLATQDRASHPVEARPPGGRPVRQRPVAVVRSAARERRALRRPGR